MLVAKIDLATRVACHRLALMRTCGVDLGLQVRLVSPKLVAPRSFFDFTLLKQTDFDPRPLDHISRTSFGELFLAEKNNNKSFS